MADLTRLGQAGLKGWREKVGARVAPSIAQRTPMSETAVRGLIGGAFFALSVVYVAKTTRTLIEELRAR